MRRRSRFTLSIVSALAVLVVILWAGGVLRPVRGPGAPAGIRYRFVDRVPATRGAARGFNVLLLTLDTTRFDHLACFGHPTIRTPRIDALARNGVACLDAVVSVPMTLPSHATILTGLYPHRHGARANGVFRTNDDVHTLAEILAGQGYETAAFIGAFVLDSRYGLDQGFELYDDDLSVGIQYSDHGFRERPADVVVGSALEWLRGWDGRPYFVWAHFFDPHAPYVPPPPFGAEYPSAPYEGEIAFMDDQIGVLLDAFDERGALDNTLIVAVGDHGEGLGEHGEKTHSLLVYDSTVRAPLLFSSASLFDGPVAIREQVGAVDIVPTVLDLLGVDLPEPVDGASLLAPPAQRPRYCFVENYGTEVLHGWSPLFAIRGDGYKYIHGPDPELYRISRDPGELSDVVDRMGEACSTLRDSLMLFLSKDPHRGAVAEMSIDLDDEAREKLAALGYVLAPGPRSSSGAGHDPKQMIDDWETLQGALNLRGRGDVNGALALADSVVKRNPGDVFAVRVLASLYTIKGDLETALALHTSLSAIDPDDPLTLGNLAEVNNQLGRHAVAAELFDRMLALDPSNGLAHVGLGNLYASTRQFARAEASYRRAIAVDPNRSVDTGYTRLGYLYVAMHRFDAAEAVLDSALQFNRMNAFAMNGLGEVCEARGRLDLAADHYRRAGRTRPSYLMPYVNLAGVLRQQGFTDEALSLCERALGIHPDHAIALAQRGLVLMGRGEYGAAEADFDRAVEISPSAALPRLNRGYLYSVTGRKSLGCAEFREVLDMDPFNPFANYNYGACLYGEGDLEGAFDHYRRAVEVLPEYAQAHKSLGVVQLDLGRYEDAISSFEKSLELAPHQREAEKMRYCVWMYLNGKVPRYRPDAT